MVNINLLLGTAQWGWNINPDEAYSLLDAWLLAGHRRIDCATNYPINRKSGDFRAAEKILASYVRAHGLRDLQITMKVGSLDNMRSPDVNLSPSFLQMMGEEYQRIFGDNLDCLMIHWDNRETASDIQQSLEAMALLQRTLALRPGLSGIRRPDLYAEANQKLRLSFDIQVKHNILQADIPRYTAHLPAETNRYFAYGINAGGIKLEENPYPANSTFLARGGQQEASASIAEKVKNILADTAHPDRPNADTMNAVGMIYAGLHPGMHGIVLGVSSLAQMNDSLAWAERIRAYDYQDLWQKLASAFGA